MQAYQDPKTYQERVADAVAREAEIIEETLPVRLTDSEVLDTSRKSAEAYQQRGQVEYEKKEANSRFKGELESLEKEIARLQGIIRSGIEYRAVQCEKVTHRDLGEVTITRLDTGHITQTRPMTPKERQMAMEL